MGGAASSEWTLQSRMQDASLEDLTKVWQDGRERFEVILLFTYSATHESLPAKRFASKVPKQGLQARFKQDPQARFPSKFPKVPRSRFPKFPKVPKGL